MGWRWIDERTGLAMLARSCSLGPSLALATALTASGLAKRGININGAARKRPALQSACSLNACSNILLCGALAMLATYSLDSCAMIVDAHALLVMACIFIVTTNGRHLWGLAVLAGNKRDLSINL